MAKLTSRKPQKLPRTVCVASQVERTLRVSMKPCSHLRSHEQQIRQNITLRIYQWAFSLQFSTLLWFDRCCNANGVKKLTVARRNASLGLYFTVSVMKIMGARPAVGKWATSRTLCISWSSPRFRWSVGKCGALREVSANSYVILSVFTLLKFTTRTCFHFIDTFFDSMTSIVCTTSYSCNTLLSVSGAALQYSSDFVAGPVQKAHQHRLRPVPPQKTHSSLAAHHDGKSQSAWLGYSTQFPPKTSHTFSCTNEVLVTQQPSDS